MTENLLKEVISEVKGVGMEKLTSGSRLTDDLGISSLEYISIVTELATRMNIDLLSITEVDLLSAKTVSDLLSLFTKR